jgi:ribosome biogenesis GTPase
MKLQNIGWTTDLEREFTPWKEKGFFPARVTSEYKNMYRLIGKCGEFEAQVSGKMMFNSTGRVDYPCVGDWVAVSLASLLDRGVIHHILPRKSRFRRQHSAFGQTGCHRKMTGGSDIQMIAANIDYVFIVSALDHDFNLRRMERYLTLAWDSGATPVMVLNKAELRSDLALVLEQVKTISMGCPIHAISCFTGKGFDELKAYTKEGMTVALLGSSGVGKSSIINFLLESDTQKTKTVRHGDDHGRHTTTSRQLFILPQGGMVIDTPGMRELQLCGSESLLEGSFEDITTLALGCKFANCQHRSEPGCAVREAIENGTIEPGRLKSYHKQQIELRYASDWESMIKEKEVKFKKIAKLCKKLNKK